MASQRKEWIFSFVLRLSVNSVFGSTLYLAHYFLSSAYRLSAEPDLSTTLPFCKRPFVHLLYSFRPMLALKGEGGTWGFETQDCSNSTLTLLDTSTIKITTY